MLRELEADFGARHAVPLYCSVETNRYRDLGVHPTENECYQCYLQVTMTGKVDTLETPAVFVGLLVTQIRWVMFEIGLCRNVHLDLASKAELRIETKFVAFRAAVDETYRYHQFFGGMAVVMPIFYIGWVRESWLALTRYKFGLTLVLFTASKS